MTSGRYMTPMNGYQPRRPLGTGYTAGTPKQDTAPRRPMMEDFPPPPPRKSRAWLVILIILLLMLLRRRKKAAQWHFPLLCRLNPLQQQRQMHP